MKAFILAAGLGTRLKPLTITIPKPVIPVFESTPFEICFYRIKQNGISDIIANIHHLPEKIISYLKTKKIECGISIEEKEILGTGGGIGKAKKHFDGEDVLIYNADIISDIDIARLIERHKQNNNWATLALVKNKETDGVLIDEHKRIIKFNDSKKSGFTFSGISVISKEIYNRLPDNSFFNIIDLYNEIIESNNKNKIQGLEFYNGFWSDIGSPESYWNLLNKISLNPSMLGEFFISEKGNGGLEIFKKQKTVFIESKIDSKIFNSIVFQDRIIYEQKNAEQYL
ncbi:MAG TPA: nucleotidyltransferase family protein [bacterium]|nr:nucleotidyltransferase family protein [bacterium]HPN32225.1 nucleotidyltransferase family protein [bacterium]